MSDLHRGNMIKIILTGIMLSGCVMGTLGQLARGRSLSTDEIDRLESKNHSVYGCFGIGGPPPIGGTVAIVVPKDTKVAIKWGQNCAVLGAEVGAVEDVIRVIRIPSN